jgi:hypothetical protein
VEKIASRLRVSGIRIPNVTPALGYAKRTSNVSAPCGSAKKRTSCSPSVTRASRFSVDRGSNGSMSRVAVFLVFSIFQAPRTKPSIRNVALTLAAERKTF